MVLRFGIRMVMVMLTCLGLASCVLETTEPLIGDAEAATPFGPVTHLDAFMLKDGVWMPDESNQGFTVRLDGNRHVLTVGSDPKEAQMMFLSLGKERYLMQFSEKPGEFNYALGRIEGDALTVALLLCDEIKALGTEGILHIERDCQLDPATDGRAVLSRLADQWPDASYTMKLVARR